MHVGDVQNINILVAILKERDLCQRGAGEMIRLK